MQGAGANSSTSKLGTSESGKLAQRIRRILQIKLSESYIRKIQIQQIPKQIQFPLLFVRFTGTNIANITNTRSQICQKQLILRIQICNIHIICLITDQIYETSESRSKSNLCNDLSDLQVQIQQMFTHRMNLMKQRARFTHHYSKLLY